MIIVSPGSEFPFHARFHAREEQVSSFNLSRPSIRLVTTWMPEARSVRRAVTLVLFASVLASFVPGSVGATTDADSHPAAVTPDEATAAMVVQGACAPYLSGGPGTAAIGSIYSSDCMNFGHGIPLWPFGGCALCFCFYDVEFANGDDGTYATWSVDCSIG